MTEHAQYLEQNQSLIEPGRLVEQSKSSEGWDVGFALFRDQGREESA